MYNDVSTSSLLLQSKHPHVLYEYKDNTPQGCAVTDNYSGGYERGKRSPSSLANLLPFTGVYRVFLALDRKTVPNQKSGQ